jgi:hypothetical protein
MSKTNSKEQKLKAESFQRIIDEITKDVNWNVADIGYIEGPAGRHWQVKFKDGTVINNIAIFHDVLFVILDNYYKMKDRLNLP